MKKVISLSLVLLMCVLLAVPALSASEGPVITMQPQSPNYPEYSVAIYTVKATGTNLSATWFIEWNGKTYNASNIGGAMQPWEGYAGESYGARKLDSNTFCFIFEGIEEELSGAKIWCVLEDGHYDVTSQPAYITIGDYSTPPEIVSIPASITVQQGESAEIRCVARSNDESQLEFLWYETSTGKLPDIQALNRGTEDSDYIFCDTSQVGTRYYVCGITTSNGGFAYSSVVEVNVEAKAAAPVAEPEILTKTLPNATVGVQYAVELKCSDPEAEFFPYYDPNTNNDLVDSPWLGLSIDGWLMGTPTQAGTYSFSISVMGAGGEDYRAYTLVVEEPAAPETTVPTETTAPETTGATAPAPSETTDKPAPTTDTKDDPQKEAEGISWWVYVLAALGATGVGVGVAVLLIRKDKH